MSGLKRKLEIENDLRKNPMDPRYKLVTPSKSKSDVWNNFKIVVFEEQAENYAQCNKCKDVLRYSSKLGTGSLLRHNCSKVFQADTSQRTLTDYGVKKISENAKQSLIKAQIKFITKDLRPLSVTEGEFLKKQIYARITVGNFTQSSVALDEFTIRMASRICLRPPNFE